MKQPRTYVTTATDGHCMLVLESPGLLTPVWLRLLLQWKYGFRREGRRVIGGGEAVFPTYVRGGLRLFPSYEGMVGFTLHGDSAEADAFLRQLALKHFDCASGSAAP